MALDSGSGAIQLRTGFKVDVGHAAFQKFREIAQAMYGIHVATMMAHGASDARFFGERKIPVLVIAPNGGEIHSDCDQERSGVHLVPSRQFHREEAQPKCSVERIR